jgi:hypothetical protein
MLVIGSRGAGGFTRLLMGSVSSQVTHHAKCPVVVIPADNRQEQGGSAARSTHPCRRAQWLCLRTQGFS